MFMVVSTKSGPGQQFFVTRVSVFYLNSRNQAFVSLDDDSVAAKVCKITLLQQLVYRGNHDVIWLWDLAR